MVAGGARGEAVVAPARTPRIGRALVGVVAVLGVGLFGGVLTSYAQGLLPDVLSPMANSAGSWCIVAFVSSWWSSRRLAVGMLSGVVALLALNVGYGLGSAVRGYSYGTSALVFWGLAAVVFGPVLGWSAYRIRHGATQRWRNLQQGAAVGFLPGLLVGEAGYGLIAIADTTPVAYWSGQLVLGCAGLTLGAVRLREPRTVMTAVGSAMVVAVAVLAVYLSV